MVNKPEDKAHEVIDEMLEEAGWHVCDMRDANISSHHGVVIRNFPLKTGHGFADYLFYIDGKAAGVIEAKKVGVLLPALRYNPINTNMDSLVIFLTGADRSLLPTNLLEKRRRLPTD